MTDPWSKPRHPVPFTLSAEDATKLAELGLRLHPALRIGFKEKVSPAVVAKTNAHLAEGQLVKVEFVKLSGQEIQTCSQALAQQTASQVLTIHGSFLVLFRKHPNRTLEDLFRGTGRG